MICLLLHVEIFLKGLFQDWKDLTTHLSFVSLEKCHSLRRSSCRDHASSNICNQIAAFCPNFKVNEIIPSAWHQKVDITFVSSYVVSTMYVINFFRNSSCFANLETLEIIDIMTSTALVQPTGFYCFAYKVKILMILTYPKLQCYRKIIRLSISFSPE